MIIDEDAVHIDDVWEVLELREHELLLQSRLEVDSRTRAVHKKVPVGHPHQVIPVRLLAEDDVSSDVRAVLLELDVFLNQVIIYKEHTLLGLLLRAEERVQWLVLDHVELHDLEGLLEVWIG